MVAARAWYRAAAHAICGAVDLSDGGCTMVEPQRKRKQTAICSLFLLGGLDRLKYAVCKVYSLVFFLVYDFSIYLCGLYVRMS